MKGKEWISKRKEKKRKEMEGNASVSVGKGGRCVGTFAVSR